MLWNGRFMTAALAAALLIAACGGHAASNGPAAPNGSTSNGHAAATAGTAHSAWDGSAGIDPYTPRFGRDRPLVAVIAASDGAELTDFVVPYGILATSGAADVVGLSPEIGPIEMIPALVLEIDETLAGFDEKHPEGADYVIVPAVHDPENPALLEWITDQHAKGATIVGVCDGVLLLANSGVLIGRHATAHWYSKGGLEKNHPETVWVKDRRYVADGSVVTTTGVSASVPVSLALVEAIAGRERAEAVAASLGVADWGAEHESDAYGVSAGHLFTAIRNHAAFWRKETVGVDVAPGVDEISLALAADAWARTARSSVAAVGEAEGPVRTRGGLRIVPDRVRGDSDAPDRMLPAPAAAEAGSALDRALEGIADSYGDRTAALVALQLEYPWAPAR